MSPAGKEDMDTTGSVSLYFKALNRLKKGVPEVVPKGIKITNDAVSIEAGRKKGSIKKSRPQFADLIAAIHAAAADQGRPENEQKLAATRLKQNAGDLRQQLDAALARENSLVLELYATRRELAKLSGEKILPIRKGRTENQAQTRDKETTGD